MTTLYTSCTDNPSTLPQATMQPIEFPNIKINLHSDEASSPNRNASPLSTKKKQHSSSDDDINDNSETEAWPSKASNEFINPSLSKTCIHIRTLYLHPLVHLCCCEVCNLPAFSIAQRETATDASGHQDYMIRYVTRCNNGWMQCKHEIMTFF